jgi:beta-galactosidase/beta-glucuronidase
MLRTEYPRPHFDRSAAWLSLNGTWEFAPDPLSDRALDTLRDWQEIVVPFPWETRASGVQRIWLETGWYRREIQVPADWTGQRIILHFGAVSHETIVWVNDVEVARHTGAYLPFEADITDALKAGRGTLVVRVHNPNDKRPIPHGKQRSIPRDDFDGVCFTPSSGIWQPVWLEPRPSTYIAGLDLRPSATLDAIEVELRLAGPDASSATAHVTLKAGSELIGVTLDAGGVGRATLRVADPRRWTPTDPHLYAVEARLNSGDRVRAYTGLRTMTVDGERVLFNGTDFFMRAVLDQGYWPDSGLTPPSDAAMIKDIELARAQGYNTIRKHIKFEDPRWLYHCDRMGMLVWAEPPSPGLYSPETAAAFDSLIAPMVARDGNHPSIVFWGLYNEEWGLDWDMADSPEKRAAAARAYDLLKAIDATRPVVENSGWTHTKTDIVDWHYYTSDISKWARKVEGIFAGTDNSFPVMLGPDFVVEKEIALPGFSAAGKPNMNSEYGGGYTSFERGWQLRWQTQELRRHDRARGYVYTELYDVEHENAGLLFYDRSAKDLGGVDPADVHAETMLIFDLVPVNPGRDVVHPLGQVRVGVRVSHHGQTALEGELGIAWGPHLGASPAEEWRGVAEISVEPFRTSAATRLNASLPRGWSCGRLHISIRGAGRSVARAFLDVAID